MRALKTGRSCLLVAILTPAERRIARQKPQCSGITQASEPNQKRARAASTAGHMDPSLKGARIMGQDNEAEIDFNDAQRNAEYCAELDDEQARRHYAEHYRHACNVDMDQLDAWVRELAQADSDKIVAALVHLLD